MHNNTRALFLAVVRLALLLEKCIPCSMGAFISAFRKGAGEVKTRLTQNQNKLLFLACKYYITEVRDWQYY